MADQELFGVVMGQPKVGRTPANFVRLDIRYNQANQPIGKDDVLLTLALHPREARVLVEELHTLLEEPLHDD